MVIYLGPYSYLIRFTKRLKHFRLLGQDMCETACPKLGVPYDGGVERSMSVTHTSFSELGRERLGWDGLGVASTTGLPQLGGHVSSSALCMLMLATVTFGRVEAVWQGRQVR